MDVIYLPRISAADFEAFRVLLKDEIAATYEIWLECRRQRFNHYGTGNIIEIDVTPHGSPDSVDLKAAHTMVVASSISLIRSENPMRKCSGEFFVICSF